jgi:hypothetical protein
MQTININKVNATMRRKATATITVEGDNGERQALELTIFYRGLTLDDTGQFTDLEKLENEQERNAEVKRQLAFMVEEIPNFVGDDGLPVATDVEFFSKLEVTYLNAISAAITEHRSLPTKPSAS